MSQFPIQIKIAKLYRFTLGNYCLSNKYNTEIEEKEENVLEEKRNTRLNLQAPQQKKKE